MTENKIEIKSYKTVYVSNDGREFDDREECLKYEKTAKGVIFGDFKNIVEYSKKESTIFNYCGNEDYTYNFIKLNTLDKVELLKKVATLSCYNEQQKKNAFTKIDECYKKKDLFIVGSPDYDEGEYWFIGSAKNVLNIVKEGLFNND